MQAAAKAFTNTCENSSRALCKGFCTHIYTRMRKTDRETETQRHAKTDRYRGVGTEVLLTMGFSRGMRGAEKVLSETSYDSHGGSLYN